MTFAFEIQPGMTHKYLKICEWPMPVVTSYNWTKLANVGHICEYPVCIILLPVVILLRSQNSLLLTADNLRA